MSNKKTMTYRTYEVPFVKNTIADNTHTAVCMHAGEINERGNNPLLLFRLLFRLGSGYFKEESEKLAYPTYYRPFPKGTSLVTIFDQCEKKNHPNSRPLVTKTAVQDSEIISPPNK